MPTFFLKSICAPTNIYSNILSDVPTNAQFILRLLRDGEHKRQPLPSPEGGVVETPESEDDEEMQEHEGNARMKKMERRIDMVKTQMSSGLRSKARRAWDKAGSRKEEVSHKTALLSWSSRLLSSRASPGSLDTRRWITRKRRRWGAVVREAKDC